MVGRSSLFGMGWVSQNTLEANLRLGLEPEPSLHTTALSTNLRTIYKILLHSFCLANKHYFSGHTNTKLVLIEIVLYSHTFSVYVPIYNF